MLANGHGNGEDNMSGVYRRGRRMLGLSDEIELQACACHRNGGLRRKERALARCGSLVGRRGLGLCRGGHAISLKAFGYIETFKKCGLNFDFLV